jgi:L-alanine-DL-glutamate epimerase-like enolase superfamily enzyme
MEIHKIEVIPLDIMPSFRRRLSRGVIDQSEPGLLKGKPVLVRIYNEEGLVGIGETRPTQPFQGETTQSTISAIKDFYAPVLIGKDPFNMEAIWSECDAVLPGNTYARAAIDFALYDLVGKMLKIPVYKLLGGRYWEKIPLQWSIGLNPVEKMIEEAQRCMEKFGLKVFCLKVGPSERWKDDVNNVKAVRKALGDGIDLGIDANGTYSPSVAIKAIREMEECDLDYVEQPVPGWDLEGMARVRLAVNTPILADESVYTAQDAFHVLKMEAADVVCVKILKPGGLFNAKKVAAVAEACSSSVNVAGTAQGVRIEAVAGAHYYASTKNIFPAGEFVMGITEEDPICNQPFVIKDGYCNVPEGPGLGVEIDEQAVEKYALGKYLVK